MVVASQRLLDGRHYGQTSPATPVDATSLRTGLSVLDFDSVLEKFAPLQEQFAS